MTIYDVAFLVMFFAAMGALLTAGFLALLGRRRAARITCGGLAGGAILYVATWVAVSAVTTQAPLGVGDPQCIDNWCLAVEQVSATPAGAITRYDVTLCIFSRAESALTSYGAHAAAGKTSDVYLVDHEGRRYSSLPHDSEAPLNIGLQPGQAIRTRRTFELPAEAQDIGLLTDGRHMGACPMIGECSQSHSAADYLVASGIYRKGSSFLKLVNALQAQAALKPPQWK